MLIEKIKLYGYIAKLSFHKKQRTEEEVSKEYNKGIWEKQTPIDITRLSMYGKIPTDVCLGVKNGKLQYDTNENFFKNNLDEVYEELIEYCFVAQFNTILTT